MRVIKELTVSLIEVDNHSLSKETLSICDYIRNGGEVPPIKVQVINNKYKLKDGRHRITAYKLLGIKKIKCKYYEINS